MFGLIGLVVSHLTHLKVTGISNVEFKVGIQVFHKSIFYGK